MGKVAEYLNQLIVGNVFDDPKITEKYAEDGSIFHVTPKIVALPESTNDLSIILKFADELTRRGLRTPVTVRGGGTNLMGSALSNGLLISTEKLNRILEFDRRERLIRVQAGLTLRELNSALSLEGLEIPVDAPEGATIGGLIAAPSSNAYAKKCGSISHYIERLEFVLPSGEVLQTGRENLRSLSSKKPPIYAFISKQAQDPTSAQTGQNSQNLSLRRFSEVFKGQTYDLLPLFFGSEGSFAVISEIILHAVIKKRASLRLVSAFRNEKTALKFAHDLESLSPAAVNLCDLRILNTVEKSGKGLKKILKNRNAGLAVHAIFDEKILLIRPKIEKLLEKYHVASSTFFNSDKNDGALVDEFENTLEYYLNDPVRKAVASPILRDFTVPTSSLEHFFADLSTLENNIDLDLPFFGSFSTSTYNLAPLLREDRENFPQIAKNLLLLGKMLIEDRARGSLLASTPGGRLKPLAVNQNLTEPEKDLLRSLKTAFDPERILNPAVSLGATRNNLKNLRDQREN